MVTIQDFHDYLEAFLEPHLFVDACPNGLQVEGKQKITKVAFSVSASLAAIQKAQSLNVDALLVHHGIFWKGDSVPIIGTKRKKIAALLSAQISLFAYHLPLDAHRIVGNNWRAAIDLKWRDLKQFGLIDKMYIGVKGRFDPQPIDLFIKTLEEYYQHPVTAAYGGKSVVESAAILSGSGYRYLSEAAKEGVDCFITGNFDEPAWHVAHEEELHFCALGHSASERIGIIALKEHLENHFGIECLFIDLPNPF